MMRMDVWGGGRGKREGRRGREVGNVMRGRRFREWMKREWILANFVSRYGLRRLETCALKSAFVFLYQIRDGVRR